MVAKALCGGRSRRPSIDVHDRRRPPPSLVPLPRPKAARRSCGCTSCWPTSSRASPRSTFRSASRSIRFRRSSARCWPAHLNDFGRYPANKGTERLPPAPPPPGSAGATSSPRPIDPETEVLVLNGTREGLFLGAIAAKRYVAQARRQARDPDSQSVLCRLCGRRGRRRLRAGLSADAPRETGFLPDLDALADELLARTVAFYLASPVQPAGRGRRRDLSHAARRAGAPLRLPGVRRRMLLEIYLERPPPHGMLEAVGPGLRQRRRVPLAVEALEPARPARRLRRRRPPLPRALLELRNVAAPQVPVPAQEVAIAAYGDEAPCRGEPRALRRRNSISPTRSSATATATGARPAASSSGSTSPRTAATRRSPLKLWREAGCASFPGDYLARDRPTAAIPAPATSASRMVQDKETTAEALHRLVAVLG